MLQKVKVAFDIFFENKIQNLKIKKNEFSKNKSTISHQVFNWYQFQEDSLLEVLTNTTQLTLLASISFHNRE